MLKLPLAVFACFSLVSSLAAAEVSAPPRDTSTPVAEASHDDDTPSAVATVGLIVAPGGATLAVEGRIVDHLYAGLMFQVFGRDSSIWLLGAVRASYHVEVEPFTIAPFVGVAAVSAGRLSTDERGTSAGGVTALGGLQLSVHLGPVLFGVEGTLMPVHTTESPSDYEDSPPPDKKRWEAVGTVAVIGGARF